MNESIENIWKNGFINKPLILPNIEKLYNQKSISYTEKVMEGFKYEVFLLIPMTVGMFLFNIWLDNDDAIFWASISSIPSTIWFFLGRVQLKALMDIDYQSNSYDYLVAIRTKLNAIRKFNKRLAVTSIPVLLFPMLLYTYFKQEGKTVGEILGVDGFSYPTISIFILLPVVTFAIAIIAEIHFKKVTRKTSFGIGALISEIEELRK